MTTCKEATYDEENSMLVTLDRSIMYKIHKTIFSRKDIGTKLLLATDFFTNNYVAIKVLCLAEEYCKKTDPWKEVKVLQLVSHIKGVIDLYCCLKDDNHIYLVMPYIKDGDLFSLVDRKNGLSEEKAIKYMLQIIDILINLKKEHNIAHHDISLENFMIDFTNDMLYLIDFGICIQENTEKSYLYYGKPCYIAPELINHRYRCNIYAVDIWCLGVCFYSMLTAMPLYYGPSDCAFHLLESGDIKLLLSKNKMISKHAKRILCKMLNPNPKYRPTLETLSALLQNKPNILSRCIYSFRDFFTIF